MGYSDAQLAAVHLRASADGRRAFPLNGRFVAPVAMPQYMLNRGIHPAQQAGAPQAAGNVGAGGVGAAGGGVGDGGGQGGADADPAPAANPFVAFLTDIVGRPLDVVGRALNRARDPKLLCVFFIALLVVAANVYHAPDALHKWLNLRHELTVLEKMQTAVPKQGDDRMVEWQFGDSRGWIRSSASAEPRDHSPPSCSMSTFDANGDRVLTRFEWTAAVDSLPGRVARLPLELRCRMTSTPHDQKCHLHAGTDGAIAEGSEYGSWWACVSRLVMPEGCRARVCDADTGSHGEL